MAGEFSIQLETKKFNQQVQQLIESAGDGAGIALKAISAKLLANMISHRGSEYRHPVDTGRSRAGWYPAAYKLGVPWTEEGSNPQAISEGKAKGKYRQRLKLTSRSVGTDLWIELINAVSYIIYLEYGHSSQAPWGILRYNMREIMENELPQTFSKELQEEWKKHRWVGAGRSGAWYFA